MKLVLPKWYDLHAHFRQDGFLRPLLRAHLDMGCAGILAMPNTKPPVSKVFADDGIAGWSIEGYLDMIRRAGGDAFSEIIVPLYLTRETTPAMIEQGAATGLLRACKYYPPHGTTGAEHALDFSTLMEKGVFRAMEDCGVVLCVHGEEHGLPAEAYFDRSGNAEEIFYRERMTRLVERFPALRIVAEHLTTETAADFVRQAGKTVAATVTPQHLLYTAGHLLQGFRYHLYCLPLLKFEQDRAALRRAVTARDNTQFFAGTDSAPHTRKTTPCGCAAGCYTGGIAPQLYAEAFEKAGCALDAPQGAEAFRRFLCLNGASFYGLPVPGETFTLERAPQDVQMLRTSEGDVTPLPLGMGVASDEAAILPWRIVQ